MTTRHILRRAGAALLAMSLALQAVSVATAHSPDPPISWPLFAADDVLQFRWKEGEVPPPKMRDAVIAAAAGAAASVASRAPTIAYAAGGASTLEYGANVFCGVNGLACADGWNAPDASESPSEPMAGSSIGVASSGASSRRRSRMVATTSRTSRSTSSGMSLAWVIT